MSALVLPLHIHPLDTSHGADLARYDLHAAAAINPNGFRQPTAKVHRSEFSNMYRRSSSSVETLAILVGALPWPKWTRSPRGLRKLKARNLHYENVGNQQALGLESRATRKKLREHMARHV